MNGIVGMCNLLLDTKLNPAQEKHLKIIQNCGASLLDLINDILDFSKLEAKRTDVKPVAFSVYTVVRELFQLFEPKLNSKKLKIEVAFDASSPEWVSTDKNHFIQILSNLIGNAIKFTEKGSITVSVSAERPQKNQVTLKVSVRDSGTGISPEGLKQLFKAFSQVDGSTTRRFGGTGLGLAISKGLVEAMGGEIWVETKLGEGSTFTFTIVAQELSPPLSQTPSRSSDISDKIFSTIHPLSILVAEDDYVNQLVITGYLDALGYQAKMVPNGVEVLNILKTQKFDVILMDCQMPELDGFQTTHKIIETYLDNRPRIIAVTASAMEDEINRCRKCGMDEILTKPVSMNTLKNALKNVTSAKDIPEASSRQTSMTETDLFDEKKFWARFKGLEEVGKNVLSEFLKHAPRMIGEVSDAIAKKNGKALELSAHTLRGALSNVSSKAHVTAAILETSGRTANFSSVSPILEQLSTQIDLLCQKLPEPQEAFPYLERARRQGDDVAALNAAGLLYAYGYKKSAKQAQPEHSRLEAIDLHSYEVHPLARAMMQGAGGK